MIPADLSAGAAAPRLAVLHVCTGNICRSPMAELIMRTELDAAYGAAGARVQLSGGGTYAGHNGQPINPPAGQILAELGIDSREFHARALSSEVIVSSDLILCAAQEHVTRVLRLVPDAAARTFTLRQLAEVARAMDGPLSVADPVERLTQLLDLAALTNSTGRLDVLARSAAKPPSTPTWDIEDPYGQSLDVYRATAQLIRAAVRDLVRGPSPVGH